METKLSAQELYMKKKVRFAVIGLIMGILAGFSALFPAVTAEVARSLVWITKEIPYEVGFATLLIASIIVVGLGDFCAGIFTTIYLGATKRNPIAEMQRMAKFKPAYGMLLGAIIAGPIGTASALGSFLMAGLTMGSCLLATTPLILSILSKIVFKERLSARTYIGIIILIIGTLIAGFAPLERGPLFIPGCVLGLVAAICFSLEGIVSTQAADIVDEHIGCGLFRCFGSGIVCVLFAAIVAAATGTMGFFSPFLIGMFQIAPWAILFGGIMNALQYNLIYGALEKCGPARTQAMVYTQPVFSVPVGLLGAAVFGELYPYEFSTQMFIGAAVVVIGTIMIICKPSELVQLRD